MNLFLVIGDHRSEFKDVGTAVSETLRVNFIPRKVQARIRALAEFIALAQSQVGTNERMTLNQIAWAIRIGVKQRAVEGRPGELQELTLRRIFLVAIMFYLPPAYHMQFLNAVEQISTDSAIDTQHVPETEGVGLFQDGTPTRFTPRAEHLLLRAIDPELDMVNQFWGQLFN